MINENERTRAYRRSLHDTYAPYTVRPALRGDLYRDDWKGVCWGVLIFVWVMLGIAVASHYL